LGRVGLRGEQAQYEKGRTRQLVPLHPYNISSQTKKINAEEQHHQVFKKLQSSHAKLSSKYN